MRRLPFLPHPATIASALLAALAAAAPSGAQMVQIDIMDFITQTTPGHHLCDTRYAELGLPGWDVCIDGHWNDTPWAPGREFVYSYSNSLVDYIAPATVAPYGIGPIRNYDPQIGYLRCFAASGEVCWAPNHNPFPPQGTRRLLQLAVLQTNIGIKNPGYFPTSAQAGSTSPDGWKTIKVIKLEPAAGCAQTVIGEGTERRVSYFITHVDFGGDLGTRPTLVVDEEQRYASGSHIERYFYAQGLGRVADASAYDTNSAGAPDGTYEQQIHNSVRSRFTGNDRDWSGWPARSNGVVQCPQGGGAW